MRKSMFNRSIAPLTACVLLLPSAARGQATTFTATGWVNAVLSSGIVYTNSLGQVLVRGVVHTERMQSSDPRVTGQVLVIAEGYYNTDGTANMQGSAYLQVGTWDAAGTNFTPTRGTWELNWKGAIQTNYDTQLTIVGYGVGGIIDGLRLEQTLTVTNASGPIDPTVPYLYAGTIKSAPVTSRVVLDNFDDNRFSCPVSGAGGGGTFIVSEANQQLTFGGRWTSATRKIADSCAWVFPVQAWAVKEGQTVEARADLISLSSAATFTMVSLYHTPMQGYDFALADGWITIWKDNIPRVTCFYLEKVAIKPTNLVLVLALTPVGENLIITGKALDKKSGVVLYQKSVVDTPASDPSLSATELAQLTSCSIWQDVAADLAGVPWKDGGSPVLTVVQDTDGNKPSATATFDNFELRTYEVPEVSIERAVQLTWWNPAGENWAVEGAPTVQGPWLPVQQQDIPSMQKLNLPSSDFMKVFRLVQAP
jgi:hypothetical protein